MRELFVRWRLGLLIAAAVAALVLVLLVVVHERALLVDDAFISFRYAQNLARGWGLRWNPDRPPGEGFTNLGFVLLIAAAQRLGVDPATAAVSVNAIAIVVAAGTLVAHARRCGAWCGVALALVLQVLLDSVLVVHATRGLETAAFACSQLLFVMAAIRAMESPSISRRRAFGLGLLGAMLVLFRPDGIVTLAAVFAAWWARTRVARAPAQPMRATAGFVAALLAGYVGWKEWYFGYALPNSFYAKAAHSGFNGIPETMAFLRAYAWLLCGLGASLVLALAVATRRRMPGSVPPELATAALLVAAWITYSTRIVHEVGFAHRFAYPLVFPVAGCLLASIRRIAATPRLARTGAAASVVALALGAWPWRDAVADFVRELGAPPAENVAIAAFRRAGEAIRAAGLGWRPLLQCPAAGALPYYAQCRHFDEGLVDDLLSGRMPAMLRKLYRESLHPDLIVEHVLPASVGVTRIEDDPLYRTAYVQEWWLGDPPAMDAGMRATWGRLDLEARKTKLFARMVSLRDQATLVGEIQVGERRWRVFVYVSNDSPFRATLVDGLSGRLDIAAADVRGEDWPPR